MKYNNKYNWCTLLFFFMVTAGNLTAQNVDSDLEKIESIYDNNKKVIIHKQINYYKNVADKKPEESVTSELKRDGSNYYSTAFNVETMVTKGVSVLVDHNSKTILLDENDPNELDESLKLGISSVKSSSSKIDFKKVGKQGCYTFHFKSGDHLKAELWFNSETFYVEKIVYYPNITNTDEADSYSKVEILITNYNTTFQPDEQKDFNIYQYIKVSNSEITVTEKYKEYKLINNIGY
jgi:hypothetical protein